MSGQRNPPVIYQNSRYALGSSVQNCSLSNWAYGLGNRPPPTPVLSQLVCSEPMNASGDAWPCITGCPRGYPMGWRPQFSPELGSLSLDTRGDDEPNRRQLRRPYRKSCPMQKPPKREPKSPPIIRHSTLSPRPKATGTRSVRRARCCEPRTVRFFQEPVSVGEKCDFIMLPP
jgi:hypothetical protein